MNDQDLEDKWMLFIRKHDTVKTLTKNAFFNTQKKSDNEKK